MFRIGSHISSAKGFLAMGKEAVRIGANTLQFFLRNPRGGRAKVLNLQDVADFNAYAKEHDVEQILAHASYVLNPATQDEKLGTFVRETVADDLDRLSHLPGAMYNIHPGHLPDAKAGVKAVAALLDEVIPAKSQNLVLLEAMSGHGNELGGSFEQLRDIIKASRRKARLGVCLDTCHVFTAGYDIVNDLDGVLREFDQTIGLGRLKAIHLNDSKNPLASHKDRHAKIGEGMIGMAAFGRIINHPDMRNLPFYLETPNEPDGYAQEIAALKKLYKG